jgi:hypothetical protein
MKQNFVYVSIVSQINFKKLSNNVRTYNQIFGVEMLKQFFGEICEFCLTDNHTLVLCKVVRFYPNWNCVIGSKTTCFFLIKISQGDISREKWRPSWISTGTGSLFEVALKSFDLCVGFVTKDFNAMIN